MKWLSLSSRVSRPPRRLYASAPSKRRRKKKTAPERPAGPRPAPGPILSLLLLAVLVGVTWWFFHHSPLFAVDKIEVHNYHAYTPEEIIELTGLETGGNIFPLDAAAAREGIIQNRDFRDARVQKIFPATVQIEVFEREPRARVKFGKLYTIDEEGVVLGARKEASERHLPLIRGLDVINNSTDLYPPEKRDTLLELLRELERLELERQIRIDEISVDLSDQIKIKAQGSLDITVGLGSYGEQLSRLKTILGQMGKDLARVREIDLRYSKVPVRFWD